MNRALTTLLDDELFANDTFVQSMTGVEQKRQRGARIFAYFDGRDIAGFNVVGG